MSKQTATMQGVFPILVTPFDENGRIDEDSLAGHQAAERVTDDVDRGRPQCAGCREDVGSEAGQGVGAGRGGG